MGIGLGVASSILLIIYNIATTGATCTREIVNSINNDNYGKNLLFYYIIYYLFYFYFLFLFILFYFLFNYLILNLLKD